MSVSTGREVLEIRRNGLDVGTKPQDTTAETILQRLSDLDNHPREEIVPYREFNVDGKLYYFTPGGFLYRREPGTEVVGGFFCGYLTDEVWHYRAYYE
jgi:hypothetical protein